MERRGRTGAGADDPRPGGGTRAAPEPRTRRRGRACRTSEDEPDTCWPTARFDGRHRAGRRGHERGVRSPRSGRWRPGSGPRRCWPRPARSGWRVAAAAWSVASCAWSLARVAWAWASEAFSVVGSTVASVWPAATDCPATTSTAVTVPETAKFRSAVVAGSIVPVAATVWVMVPVETVWTVVVVTIPAAEALEGRVANQVPTPARPGRPRRRRRSTTSVVRPDCVSDLSHLYLVDRLVAAATHRDPPWPEIAARPGASSGTLKHPKIRARL